MRTSNRGFSLVELLVAVAISMVAMVALIELYSSSRQTYRLQTMQSRLSEDGRFTVSMLQRLISQAGYRPSSDAMPSRTVATTATSTQIQFTGDNSNTVKCDGSVVNGAQTITISSSGTALKCNDGADTNWIAAAASGGNGTELADFRIGYGIDTAATHAGAALVATEYSCGTTNQDCVADSYVYGTTANTVVSVKFCFILRSEATDSSVTKTADVKRCDGTDIADTQNDHKLYRTFNTTVLLKNR